MLKWFLTLALLTYTIASHAQQYKYLVLRGGGIRGIAYAGAIKVLEEHNVTVGIEKVAGTSVGALSGLLFSLGYTAREMEGVLHTLDISTFNDGEAYFIGGQERLRKKFGWYKGNELEAWMGHRIKEQTGDDNTTFGQLHELAIKDSKFKDLYVTATNLTRQQLEVFSYETYPDMPIKIAVRASVSVPLYYAAVFIDSTGKAVKHPVPGCNVYVDGGLVANYPLDLFNTAEDNAHNRINEHTLGLKLERPEQIAHQQQYRPGIAPFRIHSFNSYMGALYNMTLEQLNKRISYGEEKKHTVYISTSNMSPRVRHITDEQKTVLFKNGEDGARAFFSAP
ncbi:MAG: patatin-like phospholipase family protein [Bacteroidota bacterium]